MCITPKYLLFSLHILIAYSSIYPCVFTKVVVDSFNIYIRYFISISSKYKILFNIDHSIIFCTFFLRSNNTFLFSRFFKKKKIYSAHKKYNLLKKFESSKKALHKNKIKKVYINKLTYNVKFILFIKIT